MGLASGTLTYLGLAALVAGSAHSMACSSSRSDDSSSGGSRSRKAHAKAGVYPESFDCDSLITAKEVETIVAGYVEKVAPAFHPPTGVAEPCAFLHTGLPDDAGVRQNEAWSFDIDCRDDALEDAKTMMSQWAAGAGDGGTGKVDVGRGGLDHGGGGLVFIDDDSPCHARVIGPRAELRLQLAKLLVERLTPDTAPMKDVRSDDR